MKRALKKRVKAVLENTTGVETPVGNSNVQESGGVRRKRTQAAMIGLAISMGATSLLVTRQSDQALAAAPVGNENTASTTSAADDLNVKNAVTATAEFESVTQVSTPENSVAVQPVATSQMPGLGAKWQFAARSLPSQYPQSGITSQSPTGLNTEAEVASKGARITAAIAKTKQIKTPQAIIPTNVVGITKSSISTPADAQLKAQQEYAIKQLQQKSDRLRNSLAALNSSENQESPEVEVVKETSTVGESVKSDLRQLPGESQKTTEPTTEVAIAPTKVYEVKPGDTLAAIANRNGTSVAALVAANNISNPNQLQIRQKLAIPVTTQHQEVVSTVVNTQVPVAASKIQPIVIPASTLVASASINPVSTNSASTTPEETSLNANTGMGGDTPVPRVFIEMERRKNANKQARADKGLQSLHAEIERLRQKYRQQQSGDQQFGNTANTINTPDAGTSSVTVPTQRENTRPVAIPVPTVRQNRIAAPTRNQNPTNNYFNYNATPVQIPVPRPVAQPSNRELPINPEWNRRNAGNVPIRVPNVNQSPSLGDTRNITVSPQLPPLAAVDRYLPRTIDENTPVSNGYIWPARGTFTSGFGPRWGRMHRGIDIANSVGTPIVASAAGVVEKAGWNRGGYGLLVDIRHPDGTLTRYAHNSRIMVQAGQQVEQGQQISAMGSTGFSTGPHLHFEIHPAGRGAQNPVAFLPPRV